MKKILDQFFQPKSVALIGATDKMGKVGQAVLQNLIQGGFKGALYPVNPKYKVIQGIPCYPDIKKLPENADLVIIATPATTIPDLIRDCGKKGMKAVLVLSAGFKEAGETGEALYAELKNQANLHGVRLIGPNCLGLITPLIGLNATFTPNIPAAGQVAFISQSGAMGSAILDWAAEKNVGFSHFVSVGSMADIAFHHLIDYFGSDNRTACILIYMESLNDARKFMSAARAFARSKPIVILKAGRSKEGAKATLSHTGSMAGNDAVYDAAFKRAGVIRVATVQQLFDCAQALAMQALPEGDRLAIVTNAGGPGILATDWLIQRGGSLATLAPERIEALNQIMPASWSKGNPVDILGDGSPELYKAGVEACLADPGVDAVLCILTGQNMTNPADFAQIVAEASKKAKDKPVYAAWMGQKAMADGRAVLASNKIPWYPFPERAVEVFMRMVEYRENLAMLYETPSDLPIEFNFKRKEARKIIQQAQEKGLTTLEESTAKQLLHCYNIPVNIGQTAKNETEAVQMAREIGFPIAMKIASPDIWHKSDVHGVRLNIETEADVVRVFNSLIESAKNKRPDARIEGVLIEKMLDARFELLIGAIKDPVFGPVLMFGLGGTATEIWKDRAIALPPLNLALASHLVEDTKISRILHGYRNQPGVPLEYLQKILCHFAYLVMDFPEIKEIEINPFGMNAQGGIALDAAITLEKDPGQQKEAYSHLSILPYPTHWIKTVTLRNGAKVLLRPIRPEDEALEAKLVQNTSKESLYFRFFGYLTHLDHQMLARFTHIDYDREMAIVAEIGEGDQKELIGVVRIVGDGWRETAEYAILVTDAWQEKGLGGILTDFILEIARAQGYKKVYASFLKINGDMRRLFHRKGFEIQATPDDYDLAEIALSPQHT
jgi:acetyltransferase